MEKLVDKKIFANIYKDKRVLITGHTGFKGSWLSLWLSMLGANVFGYSLGLTSKPSNYEVLNLKDSLMHVDGDVRDIVHLNKIFLDFKPEIVFHLAAQAITRVSYDIPQETISTNLMGTVNILECIRKSKSVKAALIVTSDKCYQNFERARGYREIDRLGGDDPYSASKACAELAVHAYIKSFFLNGNSPKVSTARAGNVIGGGDWAIDRIIPDCIRAYSFDEKLMIRNPHATRPWQHVLEPLSGYLWLVVSLLRGNKKVTGESFNFGPAGGKDRKVEELVREFSKVYGKNSFYINNGSMKKKESKLLRLNCDKSQNLLNWHTILSFKEAVRMTALWYKAFYDGKKDMKKFSVKQIAEYVDLARKKHLSWSGCVN